MFVECSSLGVEKRWGEAEVFSRSRGLRLETQAAVQVQQALCCRREADAPAAEGVHQAYLRFILRPRFACAGADFGLLDSNMPSKVFP